MNDQNVSLTNIALATLSSFLNRELWPTRITVKRYYTFLILEYWLVFTKIMQLILINYINQMPVLAQVLLFTTTNTTFPSLLIYQPSLG